jgi:hypothetical protein
MALDGKDKITPTPFDAHEQIVRGPHTHSLKDGYQKVKEVAKETVAAVVEAVGEVAKSE